jgi:LacI family transcriptional regulator
MDTWLERHRGQPLPEAVFAGSDAIALGCIDALVARGLHVPNDISVVGFDNTLLARTSRLATVQQPLEQLGRQAAEILVSQIESRHGAAPEAQSPPNIVLPTEFIAGATLDKPRSAALAVP